MPWGYSQEPKSPTRRRAKSIMADPELTNVSFPNSTRTTRKNFARTGLRVRKQLAFSHLSNGLVGAWADAERPAQNQPLSVEIKPSLFDCKRPPIINLYRRSNPEPLPFKPQPSPSNAGGLHLHRSREAGRASPGSGRVSRASHGRSSVVTRLPPLVIR